MHRWTACGAIVAGAALLALYLTETITAVPSSTFAILAGTGLVVDGTRRLYHLRNRKNPQNP